VARAARPWPVAPTSLGHDRRDEADEDDRADDDEAADVAEATEPFDATDDSGEPDAVATGTDSDDGTAPTVESGTRRGGTAVGRAVHAVLQHVELATTDPAAAVAPLAVREAAAEGLGAPGDVGTVAGLAVSALRTAAVHGARDARRYWREVPVVAPVGDRVLEGYVDLLYEGVDGELVVVDWKTDRARTPAEVDAALDRYRHQGAAYALAVGQSVGRPVAKVVFVFCRTDESAIERTIDAADLDAAIRSVRALLGQPG
jgi:ATP-dependent helicase/nuclease subunit A